MTDKAFLQTFMRIRYARVGHVCLRVFGDWGLKAACLILLAVGTGTAQAEQLLYAAPGGTGSGTSWEDAASVSAAFAAAAQDDVICLKEGVYPAADMPAAGLVLANAVTVRGGYAGSGTPGARAADAFSTLDGEDAVTNLLTLAATSGTYDLSQIVFTRAHMRGLDKSGAASSLTMTDCRLLENGVRIRETGWLNGRGAQLVGSAASELMISNCLFAGNCKTNTRDSASGTPSYPDKKGFCGGALNLSGFRRAVVDDSQFLTNGVAFHVVPSGNYCCEDNPGYGAAIYASALPLVARGCRFVGNRSAGRDNNRLSDAGIVFFSGNCSGAALSNCQFVANIEGRSHPNDAQASKYGGTVVLSLDKTATVVDVINCTFAGNLMDSQYSPGGLHALTGTARIRNCIFAGTIRGAKFNGSAAASHLRTQPNGVLDVAYSVFDESEPDSIYSLNASCLRLGAGLQYGVDPQFVTPCSTLAACVWSATGNYKIFDYRDPNTIATLLAFDAHLKSVAGYRTNAGASLTADVHSRAIDAGDPAMSVGAEPSYNGLCVNAGAYGGTAEASKSPDGAAAFDGTIGVTWPGGVSQPRFSVSVTGATENAVFNARVRILVGTEDAIWRWTNETSGVQSGDTVFYTVPEFFLKGDALYARAELSVYGETTRTKDETFTVTVDPPPCYGKGGGPTVVHVWADAPGNQTGADWMNAYHTIDQAVAAAGASSFAQMWVAGTVAHNVLFNAWPRTADILVLGGFTGVEDSPSERPAGARATIDGESAAQGFTFANTAGTITFRDLAFTRTKKGAIQKTDGAGHVCVSNCWFYGSRSDAGNATGNCLHLVGKKGQLAEVSVRDCVMEGNAAESYVSGIAVTIYANTLKRLTLDACTLITNTASIRCENAGNSPGRDALKGSEIYAIAAPVTARNCRFLVNRGCTRYNKGDAAGGNIRLEGLSAPSAFTNCLFAGNSCQYASGSGLNSFSNKTGTVLVDLASATDRVDFASCTFAYNVTAGQYAPGAIEVNRGRINVVNSLFYGNVKSITSPAGRDIDTQRGQGSATVSHSFFQGLGSDNLTGDVTLGEGVAVCADPFFVTSWETMSAVIDNLSGDYVRYKNNADAVTALTAMDLHLRTVAGYCRNDGTWTVDENDISPAIDQGDPAAAYDLEPDPNGGRLNLGAYGNTAEASHTLVSTRPELPAENVVIDFPDGYSQPSVTVTPTGRKTDRYDAVVIVEFITNGMVVASNSVEHVVKDQTVTLWSSVGFVAGDTLTVRVTVRADGVEDVVVEKEVEVTGAMPPWSGGKGGGPGIIHVRAGAKGKKDGSNWQDAYDSLADAVAAVGLGTGEVWVSGDFTNGAALAFSVAANATVRGGFIGGECTAAERPQGSLSAIDGGTNVNSVVTLSGNGNYVLDRFRICGALQHGVHKTGNGNLTLTDGEIANNGDTVTTYCTGRGLYMDGNAAARLFMTNVIVSGNGAYPRAGYNYQLGDFGAGMYLTRVARAELDGCLFLTNGISTYGTTCGYDSDRGAAIFATSSPLSVRRTRFLGNVSVSRQGNNYINGGIVRLEGNCGGSAFTNCLWSGNNETRCWSTGTLGPGSGGLVLMMSDTTYAVDVVNCTFAYNVTWGNDSPSGVNVHKGTAHVRNCIFWGNLVNTNTVNKAGRDVAVKADGRVTLAYSLFENATTSCVTAVEGTLEVGPGMVYGDPLFVTEPAERDAVLGGTAAYPAYLTDVTSRTATVGFNLHLRGRGGYTDEFTGKVVAWKRRPNSPAIDAGDPDMPYRPEPKPNGHRVNMGFYGNTPYATSPESREGFRLIVR